MRRPYLAAGAATTLAGVALLVSPLLTPEGDPGLYSSTSSPEPSASVTGSTPAPRDASTSAAPSTTLAIPSSPSDRPSSTTENLGPSTPSSTTTEPPAPASPARGSTRLSIPAAGVDSTVQGMGLSARGAIYPPPGVVMWFTGYGRVAPGSVGTSVIASHIVSRGGQPDKFYNLDRVQVGDPITVVRSDGETVRFRVTSVQVLNKYTVRTNQAVWGQMPSVPRLAIITCDPGLGFRSDGHRVANRVVIAEAVH